MVTARRNRDCEDSYSTIQRRINALQARIGRVCDLSETIRCLSSLCAGWVSDLSALFLLWGMHFWGMSSVVGCVAASLDKRVSKLAWKLWFSFSSRFTSKGMDINVQKEFIRSNALRMKAEDRGVHEAKTNLRRVHFTHYIPKHYVVNTPPWYLRVLLLQVRKEQKWIFVFLNGFAWPF